MNDSDTFQKIIDKLKTKLSVVSANLDKEIAKIESGKTVNYGSIKDRIAVEYEQARRILNDWINTEIPATYKDAFKETVADLKSKVVNVPSLNVHMAHVEMKNKSLLDVLNNTAASFDNGIQSGETNLNRLVNLTQQVVRDEARINKDIAEGYAQGGSTQTAKKTLQQDLLSKAKEGKYIEVVDKNGDVRNYELNAYAEMVARTKLSEASFQAVAETAQQVNADLLQISSHNTLTPLCAEFEGKIFSISGNDPDFPPLEETPPFHPNCLHSASIVFKEALQADGTYDGYVAFSNGDSSKPPLTKGFIPIDKRDMT